MARVDAEARQSCGRGGDVRLALAIEVVATLDPRDDYAVLLELAQELGRDRSALAEL